ncbi:DNA primase family protein [Methylobacterium gnaphalii]|uniref:Phage protein n=1 Tax=Methylobacterium gnaphalii TaxID=1010610 RepID=A0A512JPB7_9HYPH|nr:DNA primase family protein [Methylobacterium gnaphalii]GEP11805.1 phage protein [Methylobacterium gnaphalii]GJD69482.1 hypothetical protein MMMDOFMJ_2413 [Methylobacterium gnaphalii]GLS49560.1 phage protein [Methylobacterium gnaphalii]
MEIEIPSTSVDIIDRAPALGTGAPPAPAWAGVRMPSSAADPAAIGSAWDMPPGAFDDVDPADDDAHESDAPVPPVEDRGDWETLAKCAGLELNDTDNGRRLLLHFGDELQHVREVGWHTWSGKLWKREGGDEAVVTYAQRTAKRIHGEVPLLEHLPHEVELINAAKAARTATGGLRKLSAEEQAAVDQADDAEKALKGRRRSLHKHATTSGNASKISAMISQALPHKSVAPSEIDADPMLLNVENGTLRFTRELDPVNIGDHHDNYRLKVELLPHNRADLITKLAPVVYDPEAECPRFLKFMEKFQPNEAQRKFLQVYHGLGLTGMADHQCFVFNFGSGANGKSTLMEALGRLYGTYGDTLNAESVTGQGQRRGDQATPDFADLPGARYLRVSELPRGEPLKEALVKALTGGEPMKVRHLNKGFFNFVPVFKAEMSGNDKPSIGGLDNGIWRRVKLVVWPVSLAEGERRPMAEVLAEFEEERSGILNWLIEGLDTYFREGLLEPDSVREATASYRAEMDPISEFTKACVVSAEGQFVAARTMYNAFYSWCEANSVRPWKETMFGRVMPQKGFVREDGRVRRYLNVKLDMGEIPMIDPHAPGRGGRSDS